MIGEERDQLPDGDLPSGVPDKTSDDIDASPEGTETEAARERRIAFMDAAIPATPQEREALFHTALEHSQGQSETMGLVAVAGVLAEGMEKSKVFEIAIKVRADEVRKELAEFGISDDPSLFAMARAYPKFKKKYKDIRAETKAAQANA